MDVIVIVSLDITGIALLSEEDYEKYEGRISPVNDDWWLQSPCELNSTHAAYVNSSFGNVHYYDVRHRHSVRPILKIRNLRSSKLEIGDKFMARGHAWTVISEDIVLCDDCICHHCFRRNWKSNDANVYDSSDIKMFLED